MKKTVMLMTVLLSVQFTSEITAQTSTQPTLRVDQPFEVELPSETTHEYPILLETDEFIQIRVEQKGIDLVLSIHSADGKMLAVMDSPNGEKGFETLSFVAGKKETYLIKVRRLARNSNPQSGKYIVSLKEKRASTAKDLKRINAEKKFVKVVQSGLTTFSEVTQGISEYEALLGLWQELNDDYVNGLIKKAIADLKEIKEEMENENWIENELNSSVGEEPELVAETGHNDYITSVAFSPDGKTLASGAARSDVIDLNGNQKSNLNLQQPTLFDFKRRTAKNSLFVLSD